MASVETTIGGKRYLLSSDDDLEHLSAVADMVSKKIASLQKERSALSVQKAAIIAAFDLASLLIKGRKRGSEYRADVLTKANEILNRVHVELDTVSPS